MGQSKSKPREKKEEEKSTTTLVTKSKEKVMEKEAKQSDKESQPAESLLFATSRQSRPSSSSEEGSEMATTEITAQHGTGMKDSAPLCHLQTQECPPPQCQEIWKAAASQAHKTMLTLKRCEALLAIGKEAFLR